MNQYIKSQILNMENMVKVFDQACQMAAIKDDGQVSKDEAKILKAIKKANENYLKELKKIHD